MASPSKANSGDWVWAIIFALTALLLFTRNQPGLWAEQREPRSPTILQIKAEQPRRETYVVVDRRDCDKLAKYFQEKGRQITLLNVIANTRRQRNFFPFMCVFEGPDAGNPNYTFDWNDLARPQKP